MRTTFVYGLKRRFNKLNNKLNCFFSCHKKNKKTSPNRAISTIKEKMINRIEKEQQKREKKQGKKVVLKNT